MKILSKMISFNLIKDGEPGKPGEPGESSYMFIRYSIFKDGLNSDGRTLMTDYPTPESLYIGLATVNINSAPVKALNYTWSKYVGDVGDSGPMPINAGQWNKDTTYIKDSNIQPYVWQMHDGEKFFYLLVADKSLGDDPYKNNTEGSGNIWRYNENYNLLLARKIQADEIDVDDLVVKRLQTMRSGPRIEIHGTVAEFFGRGLSPNIVMGIDYDGYAVLKYFTHDGKLLYDLGPKGIDWNGIEPSRWNSLSYTLVTTKSASSILWTDVNKVIHMDSSSNTEYYKWYAGSNPTISEEDREKEKIIRTSPQHNAGKIPNGWYVVARSYPGKRPLFLTRNSGEYVKPREKAFYPDKRGVVDRGYIYYEIIYQIIDGIIVNEYYVMWNGDENGNQIWP